MALLATFRRTKVKLPGVSIDISSGEESQFEETQNATAGEPFGHYVQNIFEMKNYSGAFSARERGLFGIHYMNSTGGTLDTSWTSADFAAVETAIQSFWSTNSVWFSTGCRLIEHRWYAYGPEVVKPNPPSRITTLGAPIVGTTAGEWVRQVASTVTMRTALRRHWGRIYLPVVDATFATNGQMSTGSADALATQVRTMLLAAETSQGVVPVIYDRMRKLTFTITAVEVDSVPDIIRRRRPRDTGYKKILTS